MSVARRLRMSLAAAGRDQAWLGRELRAMHTRASSDMSVSRYCRGELVPDNHWMAVVAGMLGVRPEWLLANVGSMRPVDGEDHTEQLTEYANRDYAYCPHCGQALPSTITKPLQSGGDSES